METAYFGIFVAFMTVLYKFIEGAISYHEKTFSLRQLEANGVAINFHGRKRWQHLPMSFLNNWTASWGDVIIFPVINALVIPELLSRSGFWQPAWLVLWILVGFIVSAVFHQQWPKDAANHGHIFAIWWSEPAYLKIVFWPVAMAKAGWWHFCFMASEIAILLGFVFTPMPRITLVCVSVLLIYFVTLQHAQAILVQNREARPVLMSTLVALGIIFVVSLIKMI